MNNPKKSHVISKEKFSHDFFPFGVHYYCSPTPLPEDWEYDLQQISEAGYTHIQFRPLWRWHERIRGEFIWQDLDRLFELAQKYNLRVILKPMLENAPDWVFDNLNGTRIGFHGVPMTPFAMNSSYYAGGFMPCFDKALVIDAATNFVKKLVERYKNSPALWCYNAWNEPRSRPLFQCCCEDSVQSYRKWLQCRFGTIEELNAKLYKAWTSYDNVIPPVSNCDLVEMFLWRQWAAYAVAEQVKFVERAIRSVDPEKPVMVHAGGCNVARDPACDASDDLLNSESTDRYGFSLNIPYSPETALEHNEVEFQSSWLRRVDPEYWCHEFYAKGSKWRKATEQSVLKRYIWMAIAAGCSGFTFWEYRTVRMGIMSAGFGLRDLDGTETETSRTCEEIIRLVNTKGKLLKQTHRQKAKIALLHCAQSDLLQRLMAMSTWMGNAQNVMPDVDYPYKNAIRSAHLAYQGNGESVDWVIPGDDLSDIELLHLSCVEIVSSSTAEWLKKYVESGGVLVIEHPFAARDEKTWLAMKRPSHGLDVLCGCCEKKRVALPKATENTEIASFNNGIQISAKEWRIELELIGDSEIVAHWENGEIAAVRNSFGKGLVYTLGVNCSLSYNGQWDDNIFELLAWILKDSSVHPSEYDCDQQLWIRKRVGGDVEIWFIFNVSNDSKQIQLPNRPTTVWQTVKAEKEGDENMFRIDAGGTLVVEIMCN